MSQTVARSIRMLKALGEEPRGLKYLSELLGVHRSTVLRILQTLEHEQFVFKNESGKYHPGPGLIAIAQAGLNQIDVRRLAQPYLDKLSALCGQTIHLAAMQGDSLIYIDKREGVTNVRLYSELGRPAPWYCTGVGKVVLAHLQEERMNEIIKGIDFVRHTEKTLVGAKELRAELAKIRQQGWAVDDHEHEPLVACIAAPILDTSGNSAGAISITSPVLDLAELYEWLPDLRASAVETSRRMGWNGE